MAKVGIVMGSDSDMPTWQRQQRSWNNWGSIMK